MDSLPHLEGGTIEKGFPYLLALCENRTGLSLSHSDWYELNTYNRFVIGGHCNNRERLV